MRLNNYNNLSIGLINRISIIGGSGTGKTTLTSNLGSELKLPIYHLDGVNYFSEWKERNKKQRDKMILDKIKEEKWIIDGTYRSTLQDRLKVSDLIIYLDYSTFAQIRGILTRYLKIGGKERKEIPGCNEKFDLKFLIWVLHWRKTKRKDILKSIDKIDKSKLLIFKNRRQLNKWYKKTFNKRMNIN